MRRVCLVIVALGSLGVALPAMQASTSASAESIAFDEAADAGATAVGSWWSSGDDASNWGMGQAVPAEEDPSDVLDSAPHAVVAPTFPDREGRWFGPQSDPRELRYSLTSLVSQHVRLQI